MRSIAARNLSTATFMEQEYKFTFEHYDSADSLPAADRQLADKAREACSRAYAPYSGFKVGAAARLSSGTIITAANQESVAFPAGTCAEQTLLTTWQSQYSDDPIESMAIASAPGDAECYPCGICRQVLNDTEKRQGSPIRIIMASDTGASIVATSAHLMPFNFKIEE